MEGRNNNTNGIYSEELKKGNRKIISKCLRLKLTSYKFVKSLIPLLDKIPLTNLNGKTTSLPPYVLLYNVLRKHILIK